MNKLAAVSPYTWSKLNTAIKQEKDLNELMIHLGQHFKIDPSDSKILLNMKKKQFPKTNLVIINEKDKAVSPIYYPSLNTIYSYKEPWSFMHEYGHAYERADIFDKIRRFLPLKHKLTKDQQKLLNEYVEKAYKSGDINSQKVGEFLDKILKDITTRKESDGWRLTEELRSNARAYRDTETVIGRDAAEKILQPLTVTDISYAGHFYPDEFSRLLNTKKEPIFHMPKLNILQRIDNKLGKVREGLLEDYERFRT